MKKRAFTLIELLIVIAIIAILALIAVPNFLEAQVRAKTARVLADMRSTAVAMEAYCVDWGAYIPDIDGMGLGIGGDEMYSWKLLTTPVAFLSTVLPDTFHPRSKQNGKGKVDPWFQYWSDSANYFINNPDSNRSKKWRRYGLKYFMVSLGPNRIDDKLGNFDKEIDRSYDATNGTISFGDIGMSNIGFFPSGK